MQNTILTEDKELIMEAKRGNNLAFEQLLHRYDKQVFSIAAGYAKTAEEAKDIYQDVFIRVYKGLPNFQFRSAFSTWLHKITTNVCLSYRSRARKHRHISINQDFENEDGESYSVISRLQDDSTSDQQTLDSEIKNYVESALDTLSPKQKMVFTLKHLHGYKLREIAEMMDCTEGTIKKYLFTAIQKMRVQLQDVLT